MSGQLLIVGDYNIHWDRVQTPTTKRLVDLLDSTNLVQHVSEPTHRDGHIIDLVVTRQDDSIVQATSVLSMLSDHMAIHVHLNVSKPPRPTKTISFRKIRSIDQDCLADNILGSEIITHPATELDGMVHQYNTTLRALLDKHAPLKTKTFPVRQMIPWYSDEIEDAKQQRRKLERLWRRTRLTVHRQMYQAQKQLLNDLIKSEKARYYNDKITNSAGNQSTLFKTVDQLLHRKAVQSLPAHSSVQELADRFSNYFTSKIETIRQALDTNAQETTDHHLMLDDTIIPPTERLNNFSPATEDEIRKLICKSSDATCSLDPVPTKLIKTHTDILLPTITRIVNESLATGVFPADMKRALVKPILKKPSLDPDILKNYRPISNLQFLSKLIERVAVSRITEYMTDNKLHEPLQSAYRAFSSTETALIKVQNDIRMMIDDKKAVILVLLDLSAAFDTVDHNLLLSLMMNRLSIGGIVSDWLKSYLSERSQTVSIGDVFSLAATLIFGVPQGSVLGPILFTIYTLPIGDIARTHGLNVHFYADDTQLYMAFDPTDNENTASVLTQVENCISDIRMWMVENKLKLNDDKTEVLILTSKSHTSSHGISQVLVGGAPIAPTLSVRNLGAVFDQSLTMDDFVKYICKAAYFHLHNISSIRHCLSKESAITLVHAFISSRLDYCNALLVGITKASLAKLQRVQNMAARLVTRTKKSDHITPILRALHWLPVRQRIVFKVLLLTFKALNNLAPDYLTLLLDTYVPQRQLRSSDSSLLTVPRTRMKTAGDRAFAHFAPKMWNDLPLHIRTTDKLFNFKSLLKSHLFIQAYGQA